MTEQFHPFSLAPEQKSRRGHGNVTLAVHGTEMTVDVGLSISQLVFAVPYSKSRGRSYGDLWRTMYDTDPPSYAPTRLRLRMHRARAALAHTPYPIHSTEEHMPRFYFEDPVETEREKERTTRRFAAETDFRHWDSKSTYLRYNPSTGQGAISEAGERRDFQFPEKRTTDQVIFEHLVGNVGSNVTTPALQEAIYASGSVGEAKAYLYKLRKRLELTPKSIIKTVSKRRVMGVYMLTADFVEIVDKEWNINVFTKESHDAIQAALRGKTLQTVAQEHSGQAHQGVIS